MEQSKLDEIFSEVDKEMKEQLSEEKLAERLKEFSDENGKISSNNLSMALCLESINYSTSFLHNVLSKVLVEEK
ncbi:hypothetical protein PN398_09060 [Romboutsia sp. 1001216sp1]|uniref:hypothetical protein n=1 Tax=Romboutsia sp. 1001216sp1 TaxID=2986997 RepID=UPI0023312FCE|nr:hypothetical protein [Romboutsia sp. 1001216sp1]MDB8790873.1 hypothetical protein [Romboutsia sp. 1001216sp1]